MELITSIFSFVTSEDWAVLSRLLAAVVLGALVGLERERSGKVAGLRTHAMVSLGSALFTLISIMAYSRFPSISGVAGYDYHLVANIVVGIGFIGGGAILRTGTKVQGITTASSLWVVAAVGIAAGFGFYREAIATTILAYLILKVLWVVERRFGHDLWYKGLREEEASHGHNLEKNSGE